MSTKNQTVCPNCGTEIDVNELLYHQLEEQARQKYQTQLAREQQKLQDQRVALKTQQSELQTTIERQVTESLNTERERLADQVAKEHAQRMQDMEKELAEQTQKVIKLNAAQAEIERLKREKQSLKSDLELDMEKRLNQKLEQTNAELKRQWRAEAELKNAEHEQRIKQLTSKLQDAQRQVEQGSVQIQGEAQELLIEDWLRNAYPLDTIEEVKKGATGADTLQTINTQQQPNCGRIYYESKRTKVFQPAWIEKFKTDIQARGADVGVMVTQTMPAEFERLGQIDGIWVCSFPEFKNLSKVLRHSLIQLSQALVVQENKGDKMGMLYDFLTGTEFRMQIEAIVEGFTQLKSDLDTEKRAMNNAWKKREKQIERVLMNTNMMYGSIKGIAGNAIANVAMLEFDAEEDE